MKKLYFALIFIVLLLISYSGFSQIQIINLKCEHFQNPIGIDESHPRVTWQMESEKPGSFQKAFQMIVGIDEDEVTSENSDLWESGTVNSSVIPAVYNGPKLQPFTRYFWSVRVQDETGSWTDWSPVIFFEIGMMEQTIWKGKWITDMHDYNVKPAPYFREEFSANKKIESARAYIAAAELYELSINGERIDDHRLDPTYTHFDRRNLYVTYDVTKNLQQSENAVSVLFGNGWYNHQSTAVWFFDKAPWRARPKFCMDLRITYSDGSVETISSGQNWQTALSPVIFNSIYTIEHYDARLEQSAWNLPGFVAEGWRNSMATGALSQNITAQALHPIRNVMVIPAVEMKKQGERTWLFNFGRNIAGVTRMKISIPEGTTIRLKHVERLDSAGHTASDIGVIYPIESLWTEFMPRHHRVQGWKGVSGARAEVENINRSFRDISRFMFENRWEYTHLDARAILDSEVQGDRLVHQPLQFKVIVLSSVTTLRAGAWSRLTEYIENGEKMIALEKKPVNTHEAFPAPEVHNQFEKYFEENENVVFLEHWTAGKLNELLDQWLDKPLKLGDEMLPLRLAYKKIDGEDVVFVINDSDKAVHAAASFSVKGKIEEWNPSGGTVKKVKNDLNIDLEPWHGKIYKTY
jgi:hypothetical protein